MTRPTSKNQIILTSPATSSNSLSGFARSPACPTCFTSTAGQTEGISTPEKQCRLPAFV